MQAQDKVKTLGGRLSFLLNKMQTDEEAKVIRNEEMKKLEAQVKTLRERAEELQKRVDETGESNRIITQAMRIKQEELQEITSRHHALERPAETFIGVVIARVRPARAFPARHEGGIERKVFCVARSGHRARETRVAEGVARASVTRGNRDADSNETQPTVSRDARA